jgi:hypothetical protein
MPEGHYSFPLKLWEQTPEYYQQKEEAEARFKELNQKTRDRHISGHFEDVKFTVNGIPTVWRNSSPPYWIRPNSAEYALKLAKEYGATNYFTAEEIEEYIDGEGVMVEMAMDNLGYRKHKRDETKWARKVKKDGDEPTPLRKGHWQKLHGIEYDTPKAPERRRLIGLRVSSNTPTKLGETYSSRVGTNGMIYSRLEYNPFGSLSQLAYERVQNAHIAPDQDKYKIRAKNIKLNTNNDYDSPDGIHILALNEEKLLVEAVWPVTTTGRAIIEMAVDFNNQAIANK